MWQGQMFSNWILFRNNVRLGQKSRHEKFVSVSEPWTRWFTKVLLKRELSGIQVTTFFRVNNFQNIWAMKLIFVLKMRKILFRFWKCKKNSEKIWGFDENGVWTCCGKFSLLWREFMWSAVNVLPDSPKISDLTKKNVFQLTFVFD